jgi:hypothetical protein
MRGRSTRDRQQVLANFASLHSRRVRRQRPLSHVDVVATNLSRPAKRGTSGCPRNRKRGIGPTPCFERAAGKGVTGEGTVLRIRTPAKYGALPGKRSPSVRPRFIHLGNGLGKENAHLRGCAFSCSLGALVRDDFRLLRVVALNIVVENVEKFFDDVIALQRHHQAAVDEHRRLGILERTG